MEPLRITAALTSPLAVQLFPLALDGLLAAMVCDKAGLIEGVGERVDVDVPLARSECGRFHLASVAHYIPLAYTLGHVHKRPAVTEMMHLGGPQIRTVTTATGPNKAFRIPQPRAHVDKVRWWVVGDCEQVGELIRLVTNIGKKRSVGHGNVGSWTIESCETWPGFPVLRPDGTPMRNLPMEYPGLGPEYSVGWGPLSYPYWEQTKMHEIAQPPNTEWMGPT